MIDWNMVMRSAMQSNHKRTSAVLAGLDTSRPEQKNGVF